VLMLLSIRFSQKRKLPFLKGHKWKKGEKNAGRVRRGFQRGGEAWKCNRGRKNRHKTAVPCPEKKKTLRGFLQPRSEWPKRDSMGGGTWILRTKKDQVGMKGEAGNNQQKQYRKKQSFKQNVPRRNETAKPPTRKKIKTRGN